MQLEFSPFVASTYGTLGESAKQVLHTLADMSAATRYGTDPATERCMKIRTYQAMVADINRAIIKDTHARIHGCIAKATAPLRSPRAHATHVAQLYDLPDVSPNLFP